jgi:hypothetical protein
MHIPLWLIIQLSILVYFLGVFFSFFITYISYKKYKSFVNHYIIRHLPTKPCKPVVREKRKIISHVALDDDDNSSSSESSEEPRVKNQKPASNLDEVMSSYFGASELRDVAAASVRRAEAVRAHNTLKNYARKPQSVINL